ncbi:MAG: YIP1 family protein, partial [Vulcanimicrobiaceae bacterium]
MSLVDRAKSIILQPGASLPAFAAEPATAGNLYQSYIMPLAAIPAIASFIGLSLVGVWIPLVGTFRYPFVGGVAHAIVHWVLALVAVFIFAMIVDALAPRFGAMRDPIGALKTVAVASTPGWVAGVFGILPPLAILQLLGALYGLYLLYLGLPIFMRAPRDRAGAYAIVSILVGIAISIVLAVVLGLAQRVLPGGPHSITADASGAAIGTAIAAKVLSNAAGGG